MAYGSILGQTSSGKRVCRLVVGTSTSGWATSDCDYLCDGTADDVEINAAIQALPSTGGEIVILDGTYNITATIAMNKDNTKLSGNGAATILKRMWDSSTSEGVIDISATNGGCCVENLSIDGNKATYSSSKNHGIYISSGDNNTITGNTCNNNDIGIYISSIDNIITGNTCNNNDQGIYISNIDNIITGNTCNNNNIGIYMYGCKRNTITGNTCDDNTEGIYLSSTDYSTITGNTCRYNSISGIYLNRNNENNTITGNTCHNTNQGIYLNYGNINNTITGNTCNNNNNYGIYMSNSDNNTIAGNTCNDNGSGIYISSGDNNTITGNTCNNNNNYGIYMSNSDNNTIAGNTCIRVTGQPSDYTSSQYTIYLSGNTNNYNLIADNNIMGKNYVSGGGTRNTFEGNKYN